jgi:hypothetical protein
MKLIADTEKRRSRKQNWSRRNEEKRRGKIKCVKKGIIEGGG